MALVLTVLKLIGIILAVIAVLLVAAAAVVLIMPFRYEVSGEKYEKIKINALVKWLFGIVRFAVHYEGDSPEVELMLFGKKVFPKEDAPAEVKQRGGMSEDKPKEKEAKKEEKPKKDRPEAKKTEHKKIESPKENAKKTEPPKENAKKTEPMAKEDSLPKVQRIKMNDEIPEEEPVPEKMTAKDFVLDYLKKMSGEDRKKAIAALFGLLKSAVKHILPDYLRVYAIVGLNDPALTGYILAAAGILRGVTGKDITVVGDFNTERVEGEAALSGRIRLGTVLAIMLRFLIARPIRRFIIRYIKVRGELV